MNEFAVVYLSGHDEFELMVTVCKTKSFPAFKFVSSFQL